MHIREVRARAWKRWTSAKFHVAKPEHVRQIAMEYIERRTCGAWAVAWLIGGEWVTEAVLWDKGENSPPRGSGEPRLIEVVTAKDTEAHNRKREEANVGDGQTQTVTVEPDDEPHSPGTLARTLGVDGYAHGTRTIHERHWHVRGIGEVRTEIGAEWGVTQAVVRRMYQHGVKQMAWGVAERMLESLDPATRAELEGALFRPAEKQARDEYKAAAEAAIERLGHDPDVHVVKWTPEQQKQADFFEGRIARFGVPAIRGELMHLRVWDEFMTFPRLLNLNRKGRQRLLSDLYEAEFATIQRELQVYRDMAPLAPRPHLLARRDAEIDAPREAKQPEISAPSRRPQTYAPRQRAKLPTETGAYACPECGSRSSDPKGHATCLARADSGSTVPH